MYYERVLCCGLIHNYLLVFCRKDLCDARPKPKMSSKMQNGPTPWNGLPLVEASSGQEQYYMNGLILWNGPPLEVSGGQEQYYVEWTPFTTLKDKQSGLVYSVMELVNNYLVLYGNQIFFNKFFVNWSFIEKTSVMQEPNPK